MMAGMSGDLLDGWKTYIKLQDPDYLCGIEMDAIEDPEELTAYIRSRERG